MKGLSHTQIEIMNTFNNIFITPYKLTGNRETHFGDLAIIVDIEFKDKDKLKGVAFLEAKKRYDNSNDYTALDSTQLNRIYGNAPNSRLLLYNYQPMSSIAPTGLDITKTTGGILPKIPSTYTSVLHINSALKLNHKNDRLHKISIPFTYQFAFRYLYGMDLEYDEDKIQSVLGYGEERNFRTQYVIVVGIKPGKKGEKKDYEAYKPVINKNIYSKITDIDKIK